MQNEEEETIEEVQEEAEEEEKVDKLSQVEINLTIPVTLTTAEVEKLDRVFATIKEWVDDAREAVVGMDRDEAFRYVRLLVQKLKRVDADFAAGSQPHEKIPTDVKPGPSVSQEHLQDPERFPITRTTRPTEEQFREWLDSLNQRARRIAEKLDCVSQFLDPESDVGIEIICNDCSPDRLERCIRDADPSIEDSITIFMRHQTE